MYSLLKGFEVYGNITDIDSNLTVAERDTAAAARAAQRPTWQCPSRPPYNLSHYVSIDTSCDQKLIAAHLNKMSHWCEEV